MSSDRYIDHEEAVSVLVGTLLLIVVVIVGTLAIATILAGVSTQTSNKANPQSQASASSIPVYIGGSDNMLDLDNALAATFEATNPSMAIVSNTMSPDGIVPALQAKTLDIGALAGGISYVDQYKNPNIHMQQIGSSAVVVIAPSSNVTLTSTQFDYSTLVNEFMNNNGPYPVYIREDQSGTSDTFYSFLGYQSPYQNGTEVGDAQMINDVANSLGTLGYADYADVKTAIQQNGVKVSIVSIGDGVNLQQQYYPANPTYKNMTIAAKYQYQSSETNGLGAPIWTGNQTNVTAYNLSLIYPLNYVTLGSPNSAESVFIQWAVSPSGVPTFTKEYDFSLSQI